MKKIATKMSTPTVKMRMIWTPAEGLVIEHGDDDDDDSNDVDDGDYAESSGRLDGQPSDCGGLVRPRRLFLLSISNFITSKDIELYHKQGWSQRKQNLTNFLKTFPPQHDLYLRKQYSILTTFISIPSKENIF